MTEPLTDPVRHLYVHVPFCAHKCEYCAFYSEVSDPPMMERYVGALERELELVADSLRPRTIFFGGGTPSLLSRRQWERLLRTMERLNLLGADEWTVECNPATVSLDKARLWRTYGINRISLGVQSLEESLLDRLGRVHSRAAVFRSLDLLRRAGFENVNIDLMFAIPGQTLDLWRQTLDEVLALQCEHLSSYEVTYEDDTPLFAQLHAGQFAVDDELACAMYEELVQRAGAGGLRQYEVSNFARHHRGATDRTFDSATAPLLPDRACRHNVNYWRGGPFFGLGPSAAEFVGGVRTRNGSDTRFYCEQLEKGKRAIQSQDILAPLQRAGEIAGFGLRLNVGWDFDEFRRITGFDLREQWKAEIEALFREGLAVIEPERLRLTFRGLRFADRVAEAFLR